MRVWINIAVFRMLKFFRYIGNKFRLFWRFVTGRRVTKTTVIADAKSIKNGAVVLFDANEMLKFSFEFLIRTEVMKSSEVTKFVNRGDRVLKKKWNEQQKKNGKG